MVCRCRNGADRCIELVRFAPASKASTGDSQSSDVAVSTLDWSIAVVAQAPYPDRLRCISSMHVFLWRAAACHVLCVGSDRLTFAIFAVSTSTATVTSGGESAAVRLVSLGRLPTPTAVVTTPRAKGDREDADTAASVTHVAVFSPFAATDGDHAEVLCYRQKTGEYCCFSLSDIMQEVEARRGQAANDHDAAVRSLPMQKLNVTSKGLFRAGWTSVTWKGSYKVACTRQKFFCYQSSSGESMFECVHVARRQSVTSSVCSREHVQLPATSGGSAPTGTGAVGHEPGGTDPQLGVALRRKHCIVAPIAFRGRTAFVLYAHSIVGGGEADEDAGGYGAGSTGRSHIGSPRGAGSTSVDPTQAALLLHKRIFAHNDAWTHFTSLTVPVTVVDGTFVTVDVLLSYSAPTGVVWLSQFVSAGGVPGGFTARPRAPITDVTLVDQGEEDASLQLTVVPPGLDRHTPVTTSSSNGAAAADRSSVDVFLKSLPLDGLEAIDEDDDGTVARGTAGARPHLSTANLRTSPRDDGTAARRKRGDRPQSASQSIRDRLAALSTAAAVPFSSAEFVGDVTRIVRYLGKTDAGLATAATEEENCADLKRQHGLPPRPPTAASRHAAVPRPPVRPASAPAHSALRTPIGTMHDLALKRCVDGDVSEEALQRDMDFVRETCGSLSRRCSSTTVEQQFLGRSASATSHDASVYDSVSSPPRQPTPQRNAGPCWCSVQGVKQRLPAPSKSEYASFEREYAAHLVHLEATARFGSKEVARLSRIAVPRDVFQQKELMKMWKALGIPISRKERGPSARGRQAPSVSAHTAPALDDGEAVEEGEQDRPLPKHVQRLYEQDRLSRESRLQALRAKYLVDLATHHTRLSPERVDAFVERVTTDYFRQRKRHIDQVQDGMLGSDAARRRSPVISPRSAALAATSARGVGTAAEQPHLQRPDGHDGRQLSSLQQRQLVDWLTVKSHHRHDAAVASIAKSMQASLPPAPSPLSPVAENALVTRLAAPVRPAGPTATR